MFECIRRGELTRQRREPGGGGQKADMEAVVELLNGMVLLVHVAGQGWSPSGAFCALQTELCRAPSRGCRAATWPTEHSRALDRVGLLSTTGHDIRSRTVRIRGDQKSIAARTGFRPIT